jgi:hypothetical protein
VGEETQDTLQLVAGSSVDILMLDIIVIVVLTVDIVTEVGVFKSVGVSSVTVTAWFELVKLVGGIRRVAD